MGFCLVFLKIKYLWTPFCLEERLNLLDFDLWVLGGLKIVNQFRN